MMCRRRLLSQPSAITSQSPDTAQAAKSDLLAPLPVARQDFGRVVPPVANPQPRRRRWLRIAAALAIVLAIPAGGFYWWQQRLNQVPAGIVWSHGRLEGGRDD